MTSRLKKTYENPSTSGTLAGLRKFKPHSTVSRAEKHLLAESEAYALHRPIRKKFNRARVISLYPGEYWQADLVDMSALSSQNKGVKFLLIVVDVLTKRAFAEPLRSKEGSEVAQAFENIFKKFKDFEVVNLSTDAGKEFVNSHVQRLLQRHGIKHVVSYSDLKCSVVERVNRTLKTMIWRYFTATNAFRYIQVLDAIVDNYNSSYHRSIGMAPADVTLDNFKVAWKNLYRVEWPGTGVIFKGQANPRRDLAPESKVRIRRLKKDFEKGYTPNWTRETFSVAKVVSRNPHVYLLRDQNGETIRGKFYREELLPAPK